MVELQCQYVLLGDAQKSKEENEDRLKFKKMLLDVFYIIVNNHDLSERSQFGERFTQCMDTLCQPTK